METEAQMRETSSEAGTALAGEKAVRPRAEALLALIGRIEETVEAEVAGIRSNARFDIKASNARKSRQLYELGRVFEGLDPESLDSEHRAALARLREKLAVNEAAIRAHLSAVGEVASLLQKAIEEVQADGTYSISAFGRP